MGPRVVIGAAQGEIVEAVGRRVAVESVAEDRLVDRRGAVAAAEEQAERMLRRAGARRGQIAAGPALHAQPRVDLKFGDARAVGVDAGRRIDPFHRDGHFPGDAFLRRIRVDSSAGSGAVAEDALRIAHQRQRRQRLQCRHRAVGSGGIERIVDHGRIHAVIGRRRSAAGRRPNRGIARRRRRLAEHVTGRMIPRAVAAEKQIGFGVDRRIDGPRHERAEAERGRYRHGNRAGIDRAVLAVGAVPVSE